MCVCVCVCVCVNVRVHACVTITHPQQFVPNVDRHFSRRFKLVCPHTYPVWDGSTRDGIHEVFLYIGIVSDEFEFGRTKIFIKNPQIVRSTLHHFNVQGTKLF